MIITRISAENVLKYRQLELGDLPREGIIAISGQNESGKSTIGETVCFALFGRTFSLDEESIDRVIRWGETRCSVRLGFIAGGVEYEIARYLDTEGNHGVRFYRAGDEEHPIAKGVSAVDEELHGMLGYDYDEFIESFYLAQREITTPHPHSHAVKTMAGIAALERAAAELVKEAGQEQARIPDARVQIETVTGDIEALELEPELLGELERDESSARQAAAELRDGIDGLDADLQEYTQALPRLKSARAKKRLGGVAATLMLLAAAALGAAWYLFVRLPNSIHTAQLQQWLAHNAPWWSELHVDRLGLVALLVAAIGLLFWAIARGYGKRQAAEAGRGEALAARLTTSGPAPTEQVSGATDELETVPLEIETGAMVAGDTPAATPASAPGGEDEAGGSSEMKLQAIRRFSLPVSEATGLVEQAKQRLHGRLERWQVELARLGEAIAVERSRHAKAEVLQGVLDSLTDKLAEIERNIELREKADELLGGAARHVSHRFNRDLRELASTTLPLFTEQRYEHLQIDDDLNVQVFSSQKRDFMDLDEISSGTQRQIMLAVRLALSQELVNATSGDRQFVFLDEPFAFFDQERTRNAMTVLPALSDQITQIWVIAQAFPEGTACDLAIECSRDYACLPPSGETVPAG